MIRYAFAFLFLPIIGLVMVSAQSPDHTVSQPKQAELEYAPAPADNPMRGLVPYVSEPNKARFPHSMEFCYFSLKELMPAPDSFDWAPIEKTLAEVSQRGNQLIFRVYCDYPSKPSGTPAFLIDAGVKLTRWTNPEDKVVSHSPDYENPIMRKALTNFVAALGATYDGDPRIAFITAGLLGSWGEWHTYPKDELWASKPVQREIMTAFTKAFSKTKILLRYPAGPETYWHAENHALPFGYHDDSFGWASLDTGNKKDDWFFEPALKEAGATEKWKQHPIGGEIRPELWKRSFTDKRHPKEQPFVDCVERLHASWLLDSGLFDKRFPLDEKRKATALKETGRLGYELHISKAIWKDGILSVTVQNRGVAPFYSDWPVELSLDGAVTPTPWKASKILPGATSLWVVKTEPFEEVKIRIPNPMKGGKPLRFANTYQDDDWLVLPL